MIAEFAEMDRGGANRTPASLLLGSSPTALVTSSRTIRSSFWLSSPLVEATEDRRFIDKGRRVSSVKETRLRDCHYREREGAEYVRLGRWLGQWQWPWLSPRCRSRSLFRERRSYSSITRRVPPRQRRRS